MSKGCILVTGGAGYIGSHAVLALREAGESMAVLEVLDAVRRNGGENLIIEKAPRRPGDVPVLVADVARIKERFGWQPQHDDIDGTVRSAIEWERKLLDGRA